MEPPRGILVQAPSQQASDRFRRVFRQGAPVWIATGGTLGVLLGLSALTRNETVWLALVWAGIAWFATVAPTTVRLRLIGVVAIVAIVVFAPWAYRNWVVLGSPLPSGAATNALFLSGMTLASELPKLSSTPVAAPAVTATANAATDVVAPTPV